MAAQVELRCLRDQVDYKVAVDVRGHDQYGHTIERQDLKGKVVVLDFWYTRCAACFRKFPVLQSIFEKYKNDKNIAVWAVDKPVKGDHSGEAFQILKRSKYSFPVLLPDDPLLPEKFRISSYPTTLVLDKQGNVVFQGDIENVLPLIEKMRTAQ